MTGSTRTSPGGPAAGADADRSPEDRESLDDVDDLLDAAVAQLGGTPRDGQQAMARAVAEALSGEQHLLVQAGTGTGKSLGYLVPAVAHAVRRGERVVVSTATLALQRQVRHRDLPLVARALAPRLDREPTVSLLKGWSNYVCRHKLEGGYPTEEPDALFSLPEETSTGRGARGARETPGPLGAQVLRLRAWAEETSTGDRDDLVPGVSDQAWRAVSVTALECLGATCPMRSECLPLAAREAAAVADVVVTNHAMLGIAATGSAGVLPEHDVLVVDEAHELADRVTAQATHDLSVGTIEIASRLARRHGGLPTPDLDAAAGALAAVLDELPDGRLPGGLPPPVRIAVASVAGAARAALGALRPDRPSAGTTGPSTSTRDAGGGQAGLKMATAAMLALFEVAERMSGEDDGRDVLWCEHPQTAERAGDVRLRVAPLDVSGLIAGHLFEGRTAVLTSATLTLGGGFGPIASSVGLGRIAASVGASPTASSVGASPTASSVGASPTASSGGRERPEAEGERDPWRGLDVGSPFDYRRQGILYVARALPPPGRDGASPEQVDEMVDLVTAAGGGALGLFSSRRAAASAAEALRKRVNVPVLCQGDDQLPTLVRTFAEEDDTCLFGTLSLWQGVDVPGRTCRLVLIDRIPFPRPDDPVRSARSAAVDAAGGSGFMAVSASHAALLLAQGAGRLIRSTTDRGVVAVLDPRLVTARYGEYLVRSLPPMWRTTDRAVARDALRRLQATG